MNSIAFADSSRSLDDDVRADAGSRTENDTGADHTERTHVDIGPELGGRVHDGARIDHPVPSRNAPIKSAEATTLPSTFPRPATFQTPRVVRMSSISITS